LFAVVAGLMPQGMGCKDGKKVIAPRARGTGETGL